MDGMQEREKEFINTFSNSDIVIDDLPSKIELPMHSRFLTNDIGIKYIGNMLKGIDVRLYLAYLKMLKDKIKFIHDYDVEKSICISEVAFGITINVDIKLPYIENGMDILATSHELGHGIKSFTKVNNERYLHSNTIYDETISILFGRLCLERYVKDFGFDIYAQQFEALNIRNAVNCLKKIKSLLPKYIGKQDEIYKDAIYKLISYPIGISLANVYDNFDRKQKEEYIEFVSKFLLNIKHINFEMILEYFDIPFDATFYVENFKEYIQKFECENRNKLVLGGLKNNGKFNR